MWVRNEKTATRRLFNSELMDEPVEFNEDGVARVTKDVGERLIEHYEPIERHDPETDENE